uniref:Glycosyltransferase n=1 Tax=candidate division WOR-3 bacterium TaxID=2052148 RepID=A0A7C4CDL6_UNCW3
MKKKVVILTSVHRACDTRIFHQQARTLAEAGYAVTVVGRHPRAETVDGVSIHPIPHIRNRLSRMIVTPLRTGLVALRSGSRICHLHDPELLPIGLALALLGRRVVYDVHEDYPQQVLSKYYLHPLARRAASMIVAAVERIAGSILAAVITATGQIAARFPAHKTRVVRNYPRMTAETCGCNLPTDDTSGRFRLVHLAGTLSHVRGVTSLVDTMGLLDDSFELVLAGKWETPAYFHALRHMPGFARIRHVHHVPHPEVWQLYRRCHVGVICSLPLPRHLTALPVKLFEFMATGLPVVVSNFPLLRSIVDTHGCGLCVDPTDPKAIADAVRRLAQDRRLARTMGRNGMEAVRQYYNWNSEAAALLDLYSRLSESRCVRTSRYPVLSVTT